jgi:hypothetical protein
LLLTYLRIFPKNGFKPFRRATCAAIALNVAFIITFILISVFQCKPIWLAWERWHYKHLPGHCNDINAQAWAAAAISVVLDILTLSLPVPVLLKLNVRSKLSANPRVRPMLIKFSAEQPEKVLVVGHVRRRLLCNRR